MRLELSKSYLSTGEFETNYPGDSMEALIALLNALHKRSSQDEADLRDSHCNPKCPSHQIFSLLVEEVVSCECSSFSTSLWDYSTFAHQFYVNEIFEDLENFEQFALLSVKETNLVKSIELSSVMKCESRLQEYIRRQ